jgi:hypothetical protein
MRTRTLEDIKLLRDEGGETVIDGHTAYLRYRIRGDLEASPMRESDVWIEIECPCCSGTGQISTMCNWGCDHELVCQTCEGMGWIRLELKKGFDEDEDGFVLADPNFWFNDSEHHPERMRRDDGRSGV